MWHSHNVTHVTVTQYHTCDIVWMSHVWHSHNVTCVTVTQLRMWHSHNVTHVTFTHSYACDSHTVKYTMTSIGSVQIHIVTVSRDIRWHSCHQAMSHHWQQTSCVTTVFLQHTGLGILCYRESQAGWLRQHCVNGDSQEIGKWQNSIPHRIKTRKPIGKKFVTGD